MSKKIAFPLTQAAGPVATKSEDDYQTQNHLKTILDAHEIMNDPVKLKRVHKLAGRHKKAISSLQQLKDTYQEKFGKPAQDGASIKDDDGDEA